MALPESDFIGIGDGAAEASDEIEALERVEYALTSRGFLPIGESRFSVFSQEVFLPHVVERDGLEIYSFECEQVGIRTYGFKLVVAVPFVGPVEGFEPQKDYGRKVWDAILFMNEGESVESMLAQLDELIDSFERTQLKEPEVKPHSFIDGLAAEAEFAQVRNEMRRRFMNPVCLGVLLGFLAGSHIGGSLHESVPESRSDSGQKSNSVDQEILDPKIEGAQNGMIIGGLLGLVAGSVRVRKFRKNQKNL